jgi:hypothetical protein
MRRTPLADRTVTVLLDFYVPGRGEVIGSELASCEAPDADHFAGSLSNVLVRSQHEGVEAMPLVIDVGLPRHANGKEVLIRQPLLADQRSAKDMSVIPLGEPRVELMDLQ